MVLDTEGLAWALSLARDWTGDLQDAMQVQVPVGEHVKEKVMGSNSGKMFSTRLIQVLRCFWPDYVK